MEMEPFTKAICTIELVLGVFAILLIAEELGMIIVKWASNIILNGQIYCCLGFRHKIHSFYLFAENIYLLRIFITLNRGINSDHNENNSDHNYSYSDHFNS